MTGGLTDMPSLHTYQHALEHHDSIKTLRGRSVRPICNTKNGRRKSHMTIRKEGNSVICQDIGLDALTFYDDDTIKVNIEYNLNARAMTFISSILWPHAHMYLKNFKPRILIKPDGDSPHNECIIDGGQITLKYDRRYGGFNYVDKPVMYGYYLRRKVMKQKRAQVAEFVKYAKALAKMVDPEDYREIGRQSVTAATAWQMMTDQTYWADLVPDVLHDCCEGGWRKPRRMNPAGVQKYADEAIKHMFFRELFEMREMKNKPNENGNDRYMSGGDTPI